MGEYIQQAADNDIVCFQACLPLKGFVLLMRIFNISQGETGILLYFLKYRSPLKGETANFVFPGFYWYSLDFYRIPEIHMIFIVFPGFPSDSLNFNWISGIPVEFPRIGNPGNSPFPPWTFEWPCICIFIW
jgi:hypothetical protein